MLLSETRTPLLRWRERALLLGSAAMLATSFAVGLFLYA